MCCHQNHRTVELKNTEQESERCHEWGDGRNQEMVGDERRASCHDCVQIISDFIEMGHAEPCSL